MDTEQITQADSQPYDQFSPSDVLGRLGENKSYQQASPAEKRQIAVRAMRLAQGPEDDIEDAYEVLVYR